MRSLILIAFLLLTSHAYAKCPSTPSDCPSPTFNNLTTVGTFSPGSLSTGALTATGTATLGGGGSLTGTFSGNPTFTGSPVISGGMTTATGTSASRALADRAAEWINVKDYGAVGDDVTDDSTAITNAISAARTNQATGVTLYFPPGTYRVNSGLNFTGITTTNKTVKVVAFGAVIDSHNTGGVAIDATGSKHYAIYGLTLHGDSTDTPAIGWQMGRVTTSGSDACPQSRFYNFSLYGSFSSEAILNVACEEIWWDGLNINNAFSGGLGLVQDGINHFNLTSAFVTVTLPTDTALSFLNDRFVGLIVQVIAAPPVWIANTSHHQFNGYVSSTAGNAGLWVYQSSGGDNNAGVTWNVHTETNPTNVILITGTATSGKLIDFFYEDSNPQFTNAVFKLDTGYTSASIQGLDLRLGTPSGGATKIFDTTTWSVAGRATLPNGSTLWNLTDSQFGGCLIIGFGAPICNERSSSQDNVTAHAGGGQASATALTANVVTIGTVASPNDSVKLKATSATTTGMCQTVANSTANSAQVFGTSPDTINGIATGTGVALAAGKVGRWCTTVSGAWFGGTLN
jgi:hypothetical protein